MCCLSVVFIRSYLFVCNDAVVGGLITVIDVIGSGYSSNRRTHMLEGSVDSAFDNGIMATLNK